MAMLPPSDQQTLREMFADMQKPVTLLFFTQTFGCETCEEARLILSELTALTDRITVDEVNLVLDKDRAAPYGVDRAPAIAVLADGEDTRIRFLGAPAGYDFMSLVDAVLAVSGASDVALSEDSAALVAAVSTPTHIQVFVTPT
jgi:alkyl hydroperoxide reductase subunit AhpF